MAGMTAGDWENPYLWAGGTSLWILSLLGAFKLAVQALNNNISFPRLKWCKEIKKGFLTKKSFVQQRKKHHLPLSSAFEIKM